MIARRLIITGRVQRVWYRDWTVATAEALGLRGWVRNRRDGSVEALIAGEAEAVARMIAACHDGPPDAEVSAVAVEETETGDLARFERRPTA